MLGYGTDTNWTPSIFLRKAEKLTKRSWNYQSSWRVGFCYWSVWPILSLQHGWKNLVLWTCYSLYNSFFKQKCFYSLRKKKVKIMCKFCCLLQCYGDRLSTNDHDWKSQRARVYCQKFLMNSIHTTKECLDWRWKL